MQADRYPYQPLPLLRLRFSGTKLRNAVFEQPAVHRPSETLCKYFAAKCNRLGRRLLLVLRCPCNDAAARPRRHEPTNPARFDFANTSTKAHP